MRLLAIGDIHGCSAALHALLTAAAPQHEDTLVLLGDYVDRGPDSRGVLERVIALGRDLSVVPLRGNHEAMMLAARAGGRARRDWLVGGGGATETSYGELDAVPAAHWRFLEEQCVDCWEAEMHFFVHASVYPDLPLLEQPPYVLHWGRLDQARPHESGKVMVCGHARQTSGLPLDRGFAVCLDTGAYAGGWLTCLDVTSGQVWQADQAGRSRHFPLADPPAA